HDRPPPSTPPSPTRRSSDLFLNQLNSGDETPGAVNYGTWWSPCDELINPDTSVILSGATNTQTSCMGHSALRTDVTVYSQVRELDRKSTRLNSSHEWLSYAV